MVLSQAFKDARLSIEHLVVVHHFGRRDYLLARRRFGTLTGRHGVFAVNFLEDRGEVLSVRGVERGCLDLLLGLFLDTLGGWLLAGRLRWAGL